MIDNFCSNHPSRRIKFKGLCGSCYDKDLKARNPEYKEKQKSNTTNWSKLHPEKKKEYVARGLAKKKLDPLYNENKRNRFLKQTYGIDNNDYNIILNSQDGKCFICLARPAEGKRLHIDHNHKTGHIRGLLCHQCNWYMGIIDSDITGETLIRLNMYGKYKLYWHNTIHNKQKLNIRKKK